MEAKVSQFTLVVKNQGDALEFYTEKVGFVKKTDFTPEGGYRWVTVGPDSQDIELALFEEGRATGQEWASNWKPGQNPPIVLKVEDCRKSFEELSAKGVEFFQPEPVEQPWGVSATFSDPDGNLFSLHQTPAAWK